MMKSTYRILALTVVAVLLQSCFAAKEYSRPDVKAENLYRTEVVEQDTLSMANLSWEQLFTDPVLQGHIKKGLQNNFDIRIAIENINIAEAYLKQGKAGYLPTLSLGADWTHQELSKNSQFGRVISNSGGSTNVDQVYLWFIESKPALKAMKNLSFKFFFLWCSPSLCGLRNSAHSAGLSVNAFTAEINMATANVMANCW